MKTIKAVSLVLLFSMLICLFAPIMPVSAEMSDKTGGVSKVTPSVTKSNEESLATSTKRTGITYSCEYDNKQKKININGSVSHEVFVAHRDYIVNLYKMDFDSSLDAVLKEDKP